MFDSFLNQSQGQINRHVTVPDMHKASGMYENNFHISEMMKLSEHCASMPAMPRTSVQPTPIQGKPLK